LLPLYVQDHFLSFQKALDQPKEAPSTTHTCTCKLIQCCDLHYSCFRIKKKFNYQSRRTWGTPCSMAASIKLSYNCSKEEAETMWQLTMSDMKRTIKRADSHCPSRRASFRFLTICSTNYKNKKRYTCILKTEGTILKQTSPPKL
jgi:hypothetical protein